MYRLRQSTMVARFLILSFAAIIACTRGASAQTERNGPLSIVVMPQVSSEEGESHIRQQDLARPRAIRPWTSNVQDDHPVAQSSDPPVSSSQTTPGVAK